MNERILLLVEDAERYAGANSKETWGQQVGPAYQDLFNKKFAELIVAECIEQVRGEFLPVLEDKEMMKDTHWDGYVQCGVDSVVAIKEHFYYGDKE